MQNHENYFKIVGKVAAKPETRTFANGSSLARMLISCYLGRPHSRCDVLPVSIWDPEDSILNLERGNQVSVEGQVHRRFWTDAEGRHSRVELVALGTEILPDLDDNKEESDSFNPDSFSDRLKMSKELSDDDK